MPLIFAENEDTESGIKYADRTGVQYQFPKRLYKNIIRSGEQFIYYRGRKTVTKLRTLQIYFGTGIVGDVRDDKEDSSRLICDILDYRPFIAPVPFKVGKNVYLESGGARRGYFQRGVRRVSEADFLKIIDRSNYSISEKLDGTPEYLAGKSFYASPDTAQLVEKYSIDAAVTHLSEAYAGCNIQIMARNNPGFDILVSQKDWKLYVEVKGTQRPMPSFFMSDGERRFSKRMEDQYLLLVFYGIDLIKKCHKLYDNMGAVAEETFHVKAIQWAVVAKNDSLQSPTQAPPQALTASPFSRPDRCGHDIAL